MGCDGRRVEDGAGSGEGAGGDIVTRIRSQVASRAAVKACERCDLRHVGSGPIPGTMSTKSAVCVIGEAPGKTEDAEGRPFAGKAGGLARDWLWKAGVNPIDASYINVVSCYPGRTPTTQEVELCRPNLLAQLAAVSPDYLLVLGGVAMQALLPFNCRISDLRGLWWDQPTGNGKSAWATATYHPSAVLRNVDLSNMATLDVDTFGVVVREEMDGIANGFCGRCKDNDIDVVFGETMGFCRQCSLLLRVPT